MQVVSSWTDCSLRQASAHAVHACAHSMHASIHAVNAARSMPPSSCGRERSSTLTGCGW